MDINKYIRVVNSISDFVILHYILFLWTLAGISVSTVFTVILLKKRAKLKKIKENESLTSAEHELLAARSTDIDMHNLMKSINGSRKLYKELSRQCHPDKFVNRKEHEISEQLFQEITANKRNYNELELLKQKAIDLLNIKI